MKRKNNKKVDPTLSKVMSNLAKIGHKKNPRPKKFYQDMINKRWAKTKKD